MCCAGGGGVGGEGHPSTDCGSDPGVFPELGGCLRRGVTLLPGVGALARRAAVPIAGHSHGPRSHTWGPGSKLLIARVHRSSSPAPRPDPAPRRARISWGPHTSTAQGFCVTEKRGHIIERASKRKRVGKHIGCGT